MVCIDEEIPFEVPESWQWERWGNLSYSIQYGYNAPAEETGDIRMVRISDIQDGEVLWATVPFCHINKSEIDTYLLQKDDILFARTGGTVGKSFLVNDVPYPSIYAGYLIRTRYSNMLSAQYMKYFMECELYWEQLRNGTIATAQPNCNGKTLAKMILPIPPYNEQIRITEKLNQILEQVRKYGESQDRLDKLNIQIHDLLKKSILQEAIQGRLVSQDTSEEPASHLLQRIKEEKLRLVKEGKLKKKDVIDSTIFRGDDNKYYEQIGRETVCIDEEIPFVIPTSWEWCRMGTIGIWGAGSTPAKGNPNYYGGNVLWLRTGELNNSVVYDTEIKITQKALEECSLRMNKVGDVMIAMYGATIGKVAIAGKEMTTNQACCACTPIGMFNWYLFYFLMASQQDFVKIGEGGAQPNISREKLISHLIPVPPIAEQRRIVETLTTLLNRIKG